MLNFIIQQGIVALTIGAMYSLIALGYTMVYGVLRLINFPHSDLFMLGAYLAFAMLMLFGGAFDGPVALLPLAILVFGFVGALGVAIERIGYRPLRHSSRLAPMLSALGMAIIIQNTVMLIAGRRPLIYPQLLPSLPVTIFDAHVDFRQLIILGIAVLLMVGLWWFINRTQFGVRVRAVSENLQTARLLGIRSNRTISLIFFIGPGLGAMGGILYASHYGVATYDMGFIVGLKAFTAAILGGIGSIPGAVLGGFLLGIFETFGAGILPLISGGAIGAEYRDIFAFSLLVLVLIVKPSGFLGENLSEEGMVTKRDF